MRLLQRVYNIENLSFLENIDIEPNFFDIDGDKKEKGEEVE